MIDEAISIAILIVLISSFVYVIEEIKTNLMEKAQGIEGFKEEVDKEIKELKEKQDGRSKAILLYLIKTTGSGEIDGKLYKEEELLNKSLKYQYYVFGKKIN